jgi:hypothetical protein
MSKLKTLKEASGFIVGAGASGAGVIGFGKLAEKKGKRAMEQNAKIKAFHAPAKRASKPRGGKPMKRAK